MNAAEISNLVARRVWDSRGNPTVEVEVHLKSGGYGRAIAPAGASRGSREALDLRDGGQALNGKDVSKALFNIEEKIKPALLGCHVTQQEKIDRILIDLDGTKLKSHLGGNTMVATSMAVLHAGAYHAKKPLWQYVSEKYDRTPSLPLPAIQIFGKGAGVDIQDLMITTPGAASFDEMMEITAEIYFAAQKIVKSKGVANEGAWLHDFQNNRQALETVVKAIEAVGEKPGQRVGLCLDMAASEFYHDGSYHLQDGNSLSASALIEMLGGWIADYPILSIEDPLAETDLIGMQEFTARYGDKIQIVGDDYFVTHADLVREGARHNAANAVLIKLNQAGTVSEGIAAFHATLKAGYNPIISARSGESEDVTISHLAVGLGAGQIKVGSFTRSERMAKWNECLRIQDHIGADTFVGGTPFLKTRWKAGAVSDLHFG